MPQTDPNSSFNVAVRHLFRHLDNAMALRKNPIVSRFFQGDGSLERAGRNGDGLRAVRQAIAAAAKELLTGDAPVVTGERRSRQLAIVTKWVLEGADPTVLAPKLGVSLRQLYRERAEICTTIARHITLQARDEAPVRVTDIRQFRLRRAHALAEAGSYEQASRIYAELAQSCEEPGDLTHVLCCKADLEWQQNDFVTARRTLADAKRSAQSAHCVAMVELLESKFAWALGDFSVADAMLDRTYASLHSNRAGGDEHVRAAFFDVVLERAHRAQDLGAFDIVRQCVSELNTLSLTQVHLVPERESDLICLRLMLSSWEFNLGNAFSIAKHRRALSRAAELASSCGSLRRVIALEATSIQIDQASSAEDDRTLADDVCRLLDMADELGNRQTLAVVPIDLAGALVFTQGWRDVPAILAKAEPHTIAGSVYWAQMHIIKSLYYLKSQQPEQAAACAKRAYDVGYAMGSERMMAGGLRSLGAAAYALHNKGEAMEYLRAALSFSERSSVPLARSLTYHLAGIITGQPQYERAATELRRAITT